MFWLISQIPTSPSDIAKGVNEGGVNWLFGFIIGGLIIIVGFLIREMKAERDKFDKNLTEERLKVETEKDKRALLEATHSEKVQTLLKENIPALTGIQDSIRGLKEMIQEIVKPK